MRYVLHFFSCTKEIGFILELQGDTTKVLCSIFENPVTVPEVNESAIALTAAQKMQPYT